MSWGEYGVPPMESWPLHDWPQVAHRRRVRGLLAAGPDAPAVPLRAGDITIFWHESPRPDLTMHPANYMADFAFLVPSKSKCRRLQPNGTEYCHLSPRFSLRVHERKHGGADMLWQVGPSVHDAGQIRRERRLRLT